MHINGALLDDDATGDGGLHELRPREGPAGLTQHALQQAELRRRQLQLAALGIGAVADPIDLHAETERLVRVDPRLTASALAHLLENAAQYTPADRPITVTPDNFIRAESDPTPIAKQTVIRMNRDTLYSAAVLDLDAGPMTIALPDAGKCFLSMQVIDEMNTRSRSSTAPASMRCLRRT